MTHEKIDKIVEEWADEVLEQIEAEDTSLKPGLPISNGCSPFVG